MPNFETGISGYVIGKAEVQNAFPIDMRGNPDVCCNQCYYFRRSYQTCGLNGEVCAYPQKYIGGFCPLKFDDENKGEIDK